MKFKKYDYKEIDEKNDKLSEEFDNVSEKNDLWAMILAAMITILPVAVLVLVGLVAICFLLFGI